MTEDAIPARKRISNDLGDKSLGERVSLIYRSLPLILIVNILASILFAYTLSDLTPLHDLLTWLLLIAMVSALRFISYFRYRREVNTTDVVTRYATYYIYGSASAGLLLGIGGVLFFPEQSIQHQFFILVLFAGMGVAALSILHAYLPALYVYLILLLTPIAIKMLAVGDSTHISLGIMVFAFLAGLMHFGFNLSRSLLQTLRLRFDNIDLIKQLKLQKKEADSANIAKSKFLAAASHDLRQPLHALTLFTSVLNDTEQSPESRKIINQIDASVHALESLFNSLLDISRLDAGVIKVNKENVPLQNIFNRLINDLEPHARSKQLDIIWPACNETVFSDPTLLEQILRNFVANAIRYTQKGEVRVQCESINDKILIKVSDTGIGIPESEIDHIFDEFHQLNNPERDRNKGLGLGLSIVKSMASLLTHPIAVQSEYGKGSVFSIAVDKGEVESTTVDKHIPLIDRNTNGPRPLFVVIDDESSIRDGMLSRLQMWGSEVITAADLDEALAQLQTIQRRPDGVIADYRLRGNRTGIEAIHVIHQQYGLHVPALLITGDTSTEYLRELTDTGIQVLHKPVAPSKLHSFLRYAQRHLSGHAD